MSGEIQTSGQEHPAQDNAGQHLLKGSAWMIALRWAVRLIGLASTIVLARLLAPKDFGIVAMAMIVVGMLELLNQTGQRLAIIRNPSPTRAHYDTAWTVSVLVGLLVAAAILLVAPLSQLYFHEPRAVPVMQCLAVRAALGGFENIGTVDFRRDLRFDRFFAYNLCPKIVSAIITVGLAVLWRNYWALVAGIISFELVLVAASYVMHPYRPRFSLAKIGEIYTFSGWTLFRTIGMYFNGQVDQFVIGGTFGASVMGRYAVAADIATSPIEEINTPMISVLYPVMSKFQHNAGRLKNIYLDTLAWSAIICASVSVGVTVVAHDMVLFVLGSKWLVAEPLIGWLALAAGLYGLSSGAYTTFDVLGRPGLGARMQWVRLFMLALAIIPVAIITRDAPAVAFTRMVATAVFLPTLLLAAGRAIGITPRDYLVVLWRPFFAAATMAACVHAINGALPPSGVRLVADIALGAIVFPSVLLLLWFLAGRPDSAEKELLNAIARICAPLRPVLSRVLSGSQPPP